MMIQTEAHKLIDEWKVGTQKDFRLGLATREIVRIDLNKFEINDTSTSLEVAYANRMELVDLLTGKIDLLNLNWT